MVSFARAAVQDSGVPAVELDEAGTSHTDGAGCGAALTGVDIGRQDIIIKFRVETGWID